MMKFRRYRSYINFRIEFVTVLHPIKLKLNDNDVNEPLLKKLVFKC